MSLTDDSTKDNNIKSKRTLDICVSGVTVPEGGEEGYWGLIPLPRNQFCEYDILNEDFLAIRMEVDGVKKEIPIVNTERLGDDIVGELTTVLDACLVNEKQKQAVFRLCANCVRESINAEIYRVLNNEE